MPDFIEFFQAELLKERGRLVEDPLDALAREINNAHREVQLHAKGMLLEAKQAGDALITAKTLLPHGAFKAWVGEKANDGNCQCSYANARRYMQVARKWAENDPMGSLSDFADMSIREFLGRTEKPKAKPDTPEFDTADAEHVHKLHAMATRGTEHEAAVARAKLDSFARQFGMTGDEAIAKAEGQCPNDGLTERERLMRQAAEELARRDRVLAEIKSRFAAATREDLIEILADLKARGIWKE